MFVWILIPSSWITLLLLILHDATKEAAAAALFPSPRKILRHSFFGPCKRAYRSLLLQRQSKLFTFKAKRAK
jgi:hypothetical protein